MNTGISSVHFPISIFNFQFALSSFRGEVTELVPVPAFKAAVAVREHGEVSSILMLSRHKIKNPHGSAVRVFCCRIMTYYFL
jgi:hypothetical protein